MTMRLTLRPYKVCQPCHAYSLTRTKSSSNNNNKNNQGGNNGEGSAEQWGFNCYDDAGYRNCHQCYKFVTQTEMAVASKTDLQAASQQGTI
jgi:hypothetical protein